MQHTPTKNRLPTRLTAWLLALLMVATMLPASALATAEDGSTDPPPPAAETELQTPVGADDSVRPDPSAGTDDPVPPADPDPSAGADDPVPPEPPVGADDPVPPETPADPETPLLTEEQTVSQPAMLAGGTDDPYGFVVLNFPTVNNESRAIKLYSGNYITACDPGANVWSGVPHGESDYLVWYLEGILFLNGDLQDVRINLRPAKRYPPKQSVLVRVVNDVVMSGYDVLLDLQDGPDAKLQIDTGKRLTLNLTKTAQSPGRGYAIYGREGAKLTVCGGGELNINTVGRNEGKYYAGGIVLSGDLTLEDDG